MDTPLSIHSFPRAIVHLDGDAFFAACEQSRDPALKGRPVVTGKERGIASSMSYEAKRLGVVRGMRLRDILRICPNAIIMESDYEYYSLISKRFASIVQRYTPDVEEYSIDECFADITGMRRPLHMSYEQIVARMQKDIEHELGLTFSAGLGPNKVIAKIGSKWKKPSGTTIIPAKDIHRYLEQLPIERVWGIGPNTSAYLNKYGITNALQFARCSEQWVGARLSKPFYDIWCELNGQSVLAIDTTAKQPQSSIQKVKTFTPPSRDPHFIFSQLSKNIEHACMRARTYSLEAHRIALFLRTQDFHHVGTEIELPFKSAFPHELLKYCQDGFKKIFNARHEYRASGIILSKLSPAGQSQLDLFGRHTKAAHMTRLYEHIDHAEQKHGRHTVFLGSSFQAQKASEYEYVRNASQSAHGKHIGIPLLMASIADA
ncbi:MAG: DNA polymerase IV [Patescibacteria group bacterium]